MIADFDKQIAKRASPAIVQSFFPYILLAFSVGGILFIIFRNRRKIFENLLSLRQEGNFAADIKTGASFSDELGKRISFLLVFLKRIIKIPHAYSLREFLGQVRKSAFPRMNGRSLLKERFDKHSEGGIALHDLSPSDSFKDSEGGLALSLSNSARTLRSVPTALGSGPSARKTKSPSKIFVQVQDHSSKRLDEGESSSEEEFWLGVLRQNPRNVHPYKRLAEIYLKRGDYTEARAALAYVVRHNPRDEEASRLLNTARKALASQSVKTPE